MIYHLTRDGGWSTYDESVLSLSKVSFREKCVSTGHPLKLPSPTKLARLSHFPPASQADRHAGPVIYVYIFSLWSYGPILYLVKAAARPYLWVIVVAAENHNKMSEMASLKVVIAPC